MRVTWHDSAAVDSFIVQRRTAATEWQTVATTPAAVFLPSTPPWPCETQYFYRVGAAGEGGVGWSVDSAMIITPLAGVPLPPDSLDAFRLSGRGRAPYAGSTAPAMKPGLKSRRGVPGHLPEMIDTVAANSHQLLRQPRRGQRHLPLHGARLQRYRRLRLEPALTSDYRYCSHGLIPLCIGNFWEYLRRQHRRRQLHAAPRSHQRHLHRQPRLLPAGPDTAALSASPVRHPRYLRNRDSLGMLSYPFPPGTATAPDTLFHYPPQASQPFWYVGGDCVIVTQHQHLGSALRAARPTITWSASNASSRANTASSTSSSPLPSASCARTNT